MAAAMNSNEDNNSSSGNVTPAPAPEQVDDHELDTVMPGFRFHPTEEELVEFYLRRKIEGKKFNVDLITFLDLYRYDPWELPAMAAIGEKEWYFYVPRDRKYRNGDRPNRVTTSGYWKATGADRMIRSENSARPIGLKKTLVFYSGKAPKGIRTSWIMNEYRLPHHDTEKYQKAEISLCRVYKRAGLEDHPSVPRAVSTRNKNHQMGRHVDKASESTDASSSSEVGTALALSQHHHHHNNASSNFSIMSSLGGNGNNNNNNNIQLETLIPMVEGPPMPPSLGGINGLLIDNDLHRLVSLQHQQQQQHLIPADQGPPNSALFTSLFHHHQPSSSSSSSSQLLNAMSGSSVIPATGFSDRLWEWNWIPDQPPTTRHLNDPNFK